MSKMSESGYVGDAVDTVLVRLQAGIKTVNGVFPPSLIYLDEIDKIAAKKDYLNRDTTGLTVQQELLKLIESHKFSPYSHLNTKTESDISNVMFIAGGAFAGLDNIIRKRLRISESQTKKQIGFVAGSESSADKTNILKKVKTEDLIEYGFIPELIGRFSNIVVLDPLSEDDLVYILSNSKNNVLDQYKRIFKEHNIALDVQESLFREVARKAIESATGARGLKNIFTKICSEYLFEMGGNKEGKITITDNDLKKIA
jgi:ATP-dependent Clp protease ATP-binding subunit ClpX